MTKATSPAKGRPKKTANPSTNQEEKAAVVNGESKEDLVVFAFRLTAAERELLHKAAGPAKASKWIRTLAVAAASGDRERVVSFFTGAGEAKH